MTNPYAPPPAVTNQDRKFRLQSTVKSPASFMKVGFVCAFISGVVLEITVAQVRFQTSFGAMLAPGLILGLGVYFATRRNVPHARRFGLNVFPWLALLSFALMGMMYDSTSRFANDRVLDFSIAAFPGVLVLAVGCLLIARPRSYSRFITFVIVTTMVTGIGPMLVFDPPPLLAMLPRYLLIKLFAQAVMFGMIGWIFGDAISGPPIEVDQDDDPQETSLT